MSSWRRKNDGLLAKVNFPPYTLQMLTSRHVLVGGGGGSSRTGVANGFEIFELAHNGTHFVAEEVTRYETGLNVVMNSATYNDGKRMWLVAGQESHCQLYNIQAKVVTIENGEIPRKTSFSNKEDLRQRKKSENKEEIPSKKDGIEEIKNEKSKTKHKKLQLIIKPADSIQTDFGNAQPVQRVVRISPNGTIMATGGTDGFVRLWQFPRITKLHDLKGHDKEIDDIDFCPKSKQLATVAKDGKLIIWDIVKGTKTKELNWNPSDTEKSIFKRCRFRRIVDDSPTHSPQLFTISNSLPSRDRRNKIHYGFLQLWSLELGAIQKLVTYKENLSELAVSDDGKFVAIGTMSSGTVDMFIAFSLQKVLHVPDAHNMFITNLEFLPTKHDGPAITSNAEAAVISCSVDNKICIHSIPYRHALPFWLFLVFIILSICGAFIFCSYMGI